MNGVELSALQSSKGKYLYRGRWFVLNKPVKSTAKGKKMMVLAVKTVSGAKRVKLIHFGALGYGHNYSQAAKKSYLARSAGIRDKRGRLTKDDRWSANYWARKILWPPGPATGPKDLSR
jgi:TFIIF-interacting CTD phosphatase-like protein